MQGIRFLIRSLALGICLGALAWIPIPHHYVQLPGPAVPTGPQIEVEGKARPQDPGEFFITTLYRRPANAWWAFRALIQTDWSLVAEEADLPKSQSASDLFHDQRTLRHVVYHTCGMEPISRVVVLDLTDDSPLLGKVEVGDTLLSLQGIELTNPQQVRDLLRGLQPLESVRLEVQKPGGRILLLSIQPKEIHSLSGRGLGIVLSRQWDDRNLPKIFFRSGAFEGSSSELMLGLDVCERLLNINLRRGRRIAGTGGLALNGQVTAVQGVEQKLASARAAGASLFFLPEGQAAALSEAHFKGPVEVVTITSLHEAINWLQRSPDPEPLQGNQRIEGKPVQGDATLLKTTEPSSE